MPKLIQFEGTTHSFPDDFGDADIAMALGGGKPPPAPAASAGQQMTTGFLNVGPAASQGTDPNIGRYKTLISEDVHESDAGELLYRDPASGKLVPTNTATQVAIRDPADQKVKLFARSKTTEEGPLVGASRILTQGLAAGAPTARPGLPLPPKSATIPSAAETFATAKPYYQAFDETAGQIGLSAPQVEGIAGRMRSALGAKRLSEGLAGPVYTAISDLEKSGPQTLADLQQTRRVIGNSFKSADESVRDAAKVASQEISNVIGEISPEAGQAFQTAQKIHATGRSLEKLENAAEISGLRRARAGYGGNINTLKQVLEPIVEQAIKGRTTGFKRDEIAALGDFVYGKPAERFARVVGQASPMRGSISTYGAGGAGIGVGAMFGPVAGTAVALGIPALGMAGNKIATVLSGRQFDTLRTLVAKRSPAYSKAVAASIDKWEKAQLGFISEPSPNRLAAYIGASRALSAGLKKDGIPVTSGQLLKVDAGED